MQFDVKCGHLSPLELSQLNDLLLCYHDVFSKSPTDFGRTDNVKHKINTDDAPPVRKCVYRTSPHMQEVIQSHVDGMLEKGLVEVSHSPWAAPVAKKMEHGTFVLTIGA